MIHALFSAARSTSQPVALAVFVLAATVLAGDATAIPIAQWDFDDGTLNDSIGAYDLTAIGGGPTIAGGIARFGGDDATPAFAEVTGYGPNPEWTIALRIRSHAPHDQGQYQGILSNNSNSGALYSWQVENFDGTYQLRTWNGTFAIGAPSSGWDTLVIRKFGGNDGDVWLNGVQVVASFGANPGGLQNFRLGTNRNTNRLYGFDADWVRIWNSSEDPLTVVPEPTLAILIGLGLIGLGSGRSRALGRVGR